MPTAPATLHSGEGLGLNPPETTNPPHPAFHGQSSQESNAMVFADP